MKLVTYGLDGESYYQAQDEDDLFSAVQYYPHDAVLYHGGVHLAKTLRRITDSCIIAFPSDQQKTWRSKGENLASHVRAGADLALELPYDSEYVEEVIRSLQARMNGHTKIISVGDVTIDLTEEKVLKKGTEVHLTKREYQVFTCLAQRRGRVVSKSFLIEYLWDGEREEKIVDVFVCKIRRKLGHVISTVWGRGYRVEVDNVQ